MLRNKNLVLCSPRPAFDAQASVRAAQHESTFFVGIAGARLGIPPGLKHEATNHVVGKDAQVDSTFPVVGNLTLHQMHSRF